MCSLHDVNCVYRKKAKIFAYYNYIIKVKSFKQKRLINSQCHSYYKQIDNIHNTSDTFQVL